MKDEHFDAVIVGSGFGGSVMAYRLAEAGLRVCLLERGKSFPPHSFPRAPYKVRDNFWDPSEGRYGLYNVWSFKGSGGIVSSGLGGGSLIYANVIIRKDEKWFVNENLSSGGYEDWPVTRADLEPHYDNVERMLNVQQYPIGAHDYPQARKTGAFVEAAKALRREEPELDAHWMPLNLAVSFRRNRVVDPLFPDDSANPAVMGEPITEERENYHKKTRYTCVQCGECDLGCNTGSKNTLDYTYITAAQHQKDPADIRPLCEVRNFAPRVSGGYTVTYVQHDPEKWEGSPANTRDTQLFPPITVTCDRLILAAGTFGTPYLLFKNRETFPNISDRLGSRFSVNGDLLSFIMKSKEKSAAKWIPKIIDPSFGPVITSAIRVGDSLDGNGEQGRGFYVQDGGHPDSLSWAMELAGFSGVLHRSVHFAKNFVRYRLGLSKNAELGSEIADLIGECSTSKSSFPVLAMGRDVPLGTLSFDGRYLNCDWALKNSQEYYDRVRRVVKGIAGALNAQFQDNPSYRYVKQVLTAHPLGGCPMGRTEREGVVDSNGEVFGYPNLYIVDGSTMPGPVGPNPSLTIAAVSDRSAEHILRRSSKRE
jgi:cholesterol oxidase